MAYGDKNYLMEKISEILSKESRGKFLDIGCGDGDLAWRLKGLGFDVSVCDLDEQRFKYANKMEFRRCDLNKGLPYIQGAFDYITMLEVIEHLENPFFVLSEINRLLKSEGVFILSTPNILNLKSRFRFLFEGTYDYFREPLLEQLSGTTYNIHIFPYKFPELEYILFKSGFEIVGLYTSLLETQAKFLSFLFPLIKLQSYFKKRRSLKNKGMDYKRIYKILLSKELLYGRHLIIKTRKLR